MKSLIILLIALVGSAFILHDSAENAEITVDAKTLKIDMWIPKGAKVAKVSEGYQVSSSNHVYVARVAGGKIKLFNSAKITCTCTGGGCSPVYANGGLGCALDECTSCTGTISALNPSGPAETVSAYSAGFVNKSFKVNLATALDQKNLKMGFGSMLRVSPIQKSLKSFQAKFGGDGEQVTTLINVADRLMVMKLDAAKVRNAGGITLSAVSCSCGSGSGCELGGSWPGPRYCTAGKCSACSLSTVMDNGLKIPSAVTAY